MNNNNHNKTQFIKRIELILIEYYKNKLLAI